MIIMPQLLYILYNAPVWTPAHYFNEIQCAFRELLWKIQFARIRLETLQTENDNGGLALPNTSPYFIDLQM